MTPCLSCPLPMGTAEAKCPTCGEHFSTPRNFDRHRRAGVCVDPKSVGLVLSTGRRPGARVWVQPGREDADSAYSSVVQTDDRAPGVVPVHPPRGSLVGGPQ